VRWRMVCHADRMRRFTMICEPEVTSVPDDLLKAVDPVCISPWDAARRPTRSSARCAAISALYRQAARLTALSVMPYFCQIRRNDCSSRDESYFGIVQGNSPGWSRAHESPLHVEFGSSGGPHHGERSSHQYSPVNMPTKMKKPTSA
jgi:hypothetical protein